MGGLALAAFGACFGTWALFELWVNLRPWPPGSLNRDGLSRYLIIAGMLAAFLLAGAAALWPPAAFPPAARPAWFWLGLGLMVGGLLLRLWAIRQLGRFFVPEVAIQPGQRLVERGLYRYLRHPSYTGSFITCAGFGLALGSGLSLLVMVLVPGLVFGLRIRREEAALAEAFGAEYDAYRRRTKRLIPFVY